MQLLKSYAVLATLQILGVVDSTSTGGKIFISQAGFDYVTNIAKDKLLQAVSNIQIPNVDFGPGHASNIHITNVQLDSMRVTAAGSGLQISLSGLSVSASAHGYAQKWIFSGSCDVDASVGGSMTITADATVTPDGHPQLEIQSGSCNADINVTYVNIYNKSVLASLATLFVDIGNMVSDALNSNIHSQLCSQITALAANTLNPTLAKYTTSEPLPLPSPFDRSSVDLSLSGAIDYTNALGVGFSGEVKASVNPVQSPFTPPPVPSTVDMGTSMLGFLMTPYPLESAYFTYRTMDILSKSFLNADLPKLYQILTTDALKVFVPSLASKPGLNIKLTVRASDNAVLTIVPGTISVVAPLIFDFIDIQGDAGDSLFSLACPASSTINPDVKATPSGSVLITGKVDSITCKIALYSSSIGPVPDLSTTIVNDMIKAVLNTLVIPLVNEKLQSGIPTPSIDGFTLQNTKVALGDGYLLVTTDVAGQLPSVVVIADESLAAVSRKSMLR